jgi:AAHS family 4-hydroxybenzoate transporter-like MFS transporter
MVSVLLFGLFSLLTATANTLTELILYRAATGIGLGGAMPNLVALTNEYAPARSKSTLVMLMFCGFPLGSVIAGLSATPLIAQYGWSSIFVVGGVVPLAVLPLLFFALPESPRFLCKAEPYALKPVGAHHSVVGRLFAEGRGRMTSLLWTAFFSNLLVMYFLVNWLPSLLRDSGVSLQVAILSTALLNLGGAIGAVVLGWLLDRFNPLIVLGSVYASAAVFIVQVAFSGSNTELLLVGAALAGFGVVGAQIGLNAVCAQLYPTSMRATGIGWALGVGRIGSIMGPLLGGMLLDYGWLPRTILLAAVIPAIVAAIAVFALKGFGHSTLGDNTQLGSEVG